MINITKVLFLVSFATLLCFFSIGSYEYYITNFSSQEERLFLIHNDHRNKIGADPFITDNKLNDFAIKHAHKMFSYRSLYHSRLNFNGSYKGENIAYSQTEDPVLIFNKWLSSRRYKSNIEFFNYKRIGIGVYGNNKDGFYYCVVFSG